MSEALLCFEEVSANYGPYRALFDVSFSVGAGEVVALWGHNGAGKSTIARVASGLVRPASGTVRFKGASINSSRPSTLARYGICHVNEGRAIFGTLTVEENLKLGSRHRWGWRAQQAALREAYEAYPALGVAKGRKAALLSGGEQRQLALVKAMLTRPVLLIADELSLGLSPAATVATYALLEGLRRQGTAMVIIEQRIEHVAALADRGLVIDRGRVVLEGSVAAAMEAMAQLVGPQGGVAQG